MIELYIFFALIAGYAYLSFYIGSGIGGLLTRNSGRRIQLIARFLSVLVLLYLPVWDLIPGKIAFNRYCEKSCGLQVHEVAPTPSVLLEGTTIGYCANCLAILGTGMAESVEVLSKPHPRVRLLNHDGYLRLRLVSEPHPACERFLDYVNSREPGPQAAREAFWVQLLPSDLLNRVRDKCPDWEFIDSPGAPFVLTKKTPTKPRFLWTYLYDHRVELRRRETNEVIASYADAQYHPWINATLLEGFPRMFIYRCPDEPGDKRWTRGWAASQLFIELYRDTNRTAP